MAPIRTCPECDTTLSSDSPGGLCVVCCLREALQTSNEKDGEWPAPSPDPSSRVEPTRELAGDQIGGCKLLEEIGKGGLSTVWMAEQVEPVRRRVALKIVHWGMDAEQVVARFETERQALALLDHPNIAKVLDAGATGPAPSLQSSLPKSRPFFVTELVRGIPITTFCQLRTLAIRERLELFIQVCRAVQHAHQKGVMHRNLKPSNILVTHQDGAPMPKVLDFGLAKATVDQTLTNGAIFTALEQFNGAPAYLSPEQETMGGLDIDTRSDIYSLGVLLWEMLTGQAPFQGEVPSDLDCIVRKCLDPDRSRRYDTVNALAMDIQSHLDNEPVRARAPGDLDRFWMLVRRHKMAFGLAGAAFLLLIIALIVLATLFLREREAGRTQEGPRQHVGGWAEKAVPSPSLSSPSFSIRCGGSSRKGWWA